MTDLVAEARIKQPGRVSGRNTLAANCNVLVIVLFIGVHTALSVSWLTHDVLAFGAAVAIIYLTFDDISQAVRTWLVAFTFAICVISVMTAIFGGGSIATALHDGATFVYFFLIGFGAYQGLMHMGRDRIAKTFFWIAVILVVGAGLEVIGLVKPLSDWFRQLVNPGFVYAGNARDVDEYGGVRPKFFSPEPSILGLMISFSVFLWLSALRKPIRKDYIVAAILIVVGFYLVRSPAGLIGPIAYVLVRCIVYPKSGSWMSRWCQIAPFAYGATVALLPLFFLYILLTDPTPPSYISSTSFFGRVIAPFLIAGRVMLVHPLFGIGLLNEDQIAALAFESFGRMGAFIAKNEFQWSKVGEAIGNAFWFTFISFGIAGAVVLWAMLVRLLRLLGSPVPLYSVALATCFTFWENVPGVNAPGAWLTFFAVLAMCTMTLKPADAGEHAPALQHSGAGPETAEVRTKA